MTKRFKLPILLLIVTALVVAVLSSCTSVGVLNVTVKEDCNYKTEYVIGEELDLTGLELVVTRTDGESYTVKATEVRSDLKILNFKTDKEQKDLVVVLEYKGVSTSIIINVTSEDNVATKYTVSFNTGKGSDVESVGAVEFGSISKPADPVYSGYVFDGWYKESTYDTLWDFNTDKVERDTTLYAKWAKLYTITFINEAVLDGAGQPTVITKTVKAGDDLVDVPAVTVIDGKVGSWSQNIFSEITSDMTVYAVYKDATYTVEFYYVEEDGVTRNILHTFRDVKHGTNLAVEQSEAIANINVPQVIGHKHFDRWSQEFTYVTSNLSICALYVTNTYDVTFSLNYEGAGEYDAILGVTYNNPIDRPQVDPTRVGYAFEGWYKNAECSTGNQWNFNTDRVKGNTTIYAKWTKLYSVRFLIDANVQIDEELTETFELNGKTYYLYEIIEAKEGQDVALIATPSKEGYSAKWNKEAIELLDLKTDVNVIANFTINSYQVIFFNYDRTVLKEESVEYKGYATAPSTAPVRVGYSFSGWDKEFNLITANLEVTALFEANDYSVTVHPNNGLQPYDIYATYDSRIDLQTPSYAGYHFVGWYTDATYQNEWDISKDVFTTAKDGQLHLYAYWLKIHTVDFLDDKLLLQEYRSVIDGNVVEDIPAFSELEGKNGGWYERLTSGVIASEPFNFEDPIHSDVTLVLQYTVKKYNVTFYKEVGQYHHNLTVEHGKSVADTQIIDDPVMEGKIFIKWDKPLDYVIVEDTDFLAEYETIYFTVTWGQGSSITSKVAYGKPASFPTENYELPVKQGNSLSGWVMVSHCGEGDCNGSNELSVKCDMTVDPVWTPNVYTVEFRNRDTNSVYTQIVDGVAQQDQKKQFGQFIDVNTTMPQSTMVEEGKQFVAWDVDLLTVGYAVESGRWTLTNELGGENGTFDLSVDASLVIRGDEIYYVTDNPDTLVNSLNYNWDILKKYRLYKTESGWSVGADALTTYNTISFGGRFFYSIQKDTTFFSRHEVLVFTVNYVTGTNDFEITPENYEYNALSIEPSMGNRNNYVFLGWYQDDQFNIKYQFGTPVTADLTLYARWEETELGSACLHYELNEQGTAYSLTSFNNVTASEIPANVTVANYYNGLPVESIGAEAFANVALNAGIQTIKLPNTLRHIGPGAFMNMPSLKEITIPEGVSIIPDNAFNGATALEKVIFGNNSQVTTIGKNAFARNVSLKYSVALGNQVAFTLPATITTIESGAFYGCLGLKEITFPKAVLSIGDKAFAGANNLRYVVFEKDTPANLGVEVFQNYTSLANAFRIYVPEDGIQRYKGANANANWKLLESKILSLNSVERSGEWAYQLNVAGRAELVQYLGSDSVIDVPETIQIQTGEIITVAGLGNYAFDSTITEVELLSSLNISEFTFNSADNLKKITISITDVNLINANYLAQAYVSVASLDTLKISSTITVSELFGGAAPTSLLRVETLDNDTSIIAGFLANCVYVQEVLINGRIREIGDNAFLNCTALREVTFDNTEYSLLTNVGTNAFSGAISLEGFKVIDSAMNVVEGLPNSVTTIGEGAFDGTKWLNANSQDLVVIGNGILYRYRGSDAVVEISDTITSITAGAFKGNTNLRQVYVINPESALLTEIGVSAFENCVNLESVVLPASLNKIYEKAFAGNKKLQTVVLFGKNEDAPSLYGNVNDGTHSFADTRSNVDVYVDSSVNVTSWGYSFNYVNVEGLAMNVGATSDENWVYANAFGGTGIILIKSLSAAESLVVPETVGTRPSYEMANYALPRTLKYLAYSTRILNYGDLTFAGVTFLEELTIYNDVEGGTHRVEPEALMSLFAQNSGIKVLNTLSDRSISALIGGILPENVKKVNILANETVVAGSFLENNEYVEEITVTIGGTVYNLEDTSEVKSDLITSVGVKAFRGTKWMDNLSNEFVIILGGNLVDYKGSNPVIDVPASVSEINGGLFENDNFVEVVFLPTGITAVGNRAFYGASKLTKVFFSSSSVPSIGNQTFDVNAVNQRGFEVYVPASSYSQYASAQNWSNARPLSDEGVVRVKNEISRKGNRVSYVEYVYQVVGVGAKLLLSRNFAEVTTDGVTTIDEGTIAIVPASLATPDGSSSYGITSVGNNVFMSAVKEISLSLLNTINEYSFKNLGNLDVIALTGVESESDLLRRKIDGDTLNNLFNAHSARAIEYNGSVTLSALLDTTTPSNYSSITAVKISDGVTETVEEMLKGWTNVDEITFPGSIVKVGINSLEDTAWYRNYYSQTLGDFVVLGGTLLYKYKGSAGGTIRVPDQITIVNTGAFSNYDGAEWKSSIGANEISFSETSKAHTILDYAFAGLKKLVNVALPASMRRIADNAFEGTLITKQNDMLIASGSVAKEGSTLIKYYGTASTFVIPHMVKKIAANAFEGNLTLTSVTYDFVNGSILTTICEDAFNGAVNLETLTLPSTVKNVGKDAFFNTKWFANKLATGADVVIGGVLYQKVSYNADGESYYNLRPGIVSVTEGALVAMDKTFTIDGVEYGATNPRVTATKLIIYPGVNLPQDEMYSIMSKVTSVQTNGEVTLSALIGNREPLENITTLSFFNDTTSIVSEYAYGWNSIANVETIPYNVVAIGERAFEGTEWFRNLSGNGIIYAGGETGSSVILKYLGEEENVQIRYATGIAPDAFRGNETIKSVTFLESAGITEIPAYAFMDCVNLASVTLTDKIVKFGEKAFENTAWLNNYESDFVIIDGAVIAYVGEGGEVRIPKEAKKIYDYVFRGNDTITSVVFDENCLINTIESNLFRDCVNLENITLNEHITHVERTALEGTLWLKQASEGTNPILTYENGYYGIKRIVLYVGKNQTYRITADITEIVPTAFSGVTSLSQLVFAEGKLKSIPDGAFEGCTSLTTVTIASNVENVGANAFAGTPWYATQNAEFVVVNGTLVKYNGTATDVVLPLGIKAIESGVFSGKSITRIDMSATVIEEIPAYAFKDIATLSEVVLSTSTNVIGRGAFEGTAFINNASDEFVILNGVLVKYNGIDNVVYLPEEVKVIATDAFYGNVDLAGISFSANVIILEEAFVGTSLTMVDGEEYVVEMALNAFDGTTYAEPINDFTIIGGTLVKFVGGGKVVIPENVTYIPENVFKGNELITEVDFSMVKGALEIAPNAFRNAINLSSVVFSDNINRIGTRAFYNTKWQENYNSDLIISDEGKLLAYVGEGTIVNIPSNVVAFAEGVFAGNANVTTIQFAQGAMVDIPAYAFKDCTALLNLTFPRVAFEVGEGAFENTAWLRRQNDYVVVSGMLVAYKGTSTEIEIPATVTKIYDYVFKGNETITSLSFASGSTLNTIAGETFVGCSSLATVTFRSTIEHLDMGAFEGTAWKTNFEGDFVIVNGKLLAYLGNSAEVVIPGTVTTIAENAFKGNLNITSLSFDLSSYLDTIPQRAFEGCANLSVVNFPESIREIGKDAFKGTKWLENLENSLTESDAGCYVYKGRLLIFVGGTENDAEITLPEGITSISKNAFVGSGVERIYIRESVTDPRSIALDEGALDEISSIVIADAYINAFREDPTWSKYLLKMIPASER